MWKSYVCNAYELYLHVIVIFRSVYLEIYILGVKCRLVFILGCLKIVMIVFDGKNLFAGKRVEVKPLRGECTVRI